MKTLAVLVTLGLTTIAALQAPSCITDNKYCTAQFSAYKAVTNDMTNMTTQLLQQSFDFLFLSANFDQHIQDRPGLEKLYRGISDRAWADTIALMKYQTKRGFQAKLNSEEPRSFAAEWHGINLPAVTSEHDSLKLALQYEKLMAEMAHGIHRTVSVAAHRDLAQYDPDAARFLDEQIIEHRSDSIRKLTGYVHILEGILNQDSATQHLGLHMFDEHLASSVH